MTQESTDLTIKEFQDWVYSSWLNYKGELPTREVQMLFIVEELGEVAELLRKSIGGHDKTHKNIAGAISEEIGDLFLSVVTLASSEGVNLAEAAAEAKAKIIARHGG